MKFFNSTSPFASVIFFFFTVMTTAGCVTVPSDRAGVEVDKTLAERVISYCKKNFGPRISRVAKTSGYANLRTKHGCGNQCLREFLITNVEFVEAEVSAESANLNLDFVFPREEGKFRYFVAERGDERCEAFETTSNGAYRSWLSRLTDDKCIAVERITHFVSNYQIEREFIGDVRTPVYMRSSKVRDRRTQEVVAENVDIDFEFGTFETSVDLFSPTAGLSCRSQYGFEFLSAAIQPKYSAE